MNEEKLVEVYAGTNIDVQMVKQILEKEGVKCFIKDEALGTWVPWQAAPGGAGAIKITVPEKEAKKAKEILEKNEIN